MGLSVDPPAYPTRVRRTPGRLPNRESGPQNQPKAKVAVSVAFGRDASIGGIAADRVAVPYDILPVMAVPSDPVGCDAVMTPGTGTRKYAATDPAASIPIRIAFLIVSMAYPPPVDSLADRRVYPSRRDRDPYIMMTLFGGTRFARARLEGAIVLTRKYGINICDGEIRDARPLGETLSEAARERIRESIRNP